MPSRLALSCLLALGFTLSLGAGVALASKQVIDYFGTESGRGTLGGQFKGPYGVAVNNSGAGPADKGEVYVVDGENSRIQRFSRNDSGTPADPADDTYDFISAWGAGVDSAAAGSDYEICTVASQCAAGVSSGVNGALGRDSLQGSGTLGATGLTVDQDTGEVYVSDPVNFRINVYAGDGTFLRSLGYGVVASGPGQAAGPSERQQLTLKADGGKFSLSFKGRATGPRGTGSRQSNSTIMDSVVSREGTFAVGQGISGQGIAPGTTIAGIVKGGESDTIKLSQPATESTEVLAPIFGDPLPHNASAVEVEAALNALPSIGGTGGTVTVSGGPGDSTGSTPYTIEFGGSLSGQPVPPIIATEGGLTIGSGTASAAVSASVEGGAYEVCNAVAGDVCKAGGGGNEAGQVGGVLETSHAIGLGIAVSQPDGNPATGSVFLADTGNHRVNTYNLDGSSPSSFGASTFTNGQPAGIAVDSRGIVYVTNGIVDLDRTIERYDSQNANGGGVGFGAPIGAAALAPGSNPALVVEPDSDGAGPDTDVLYLLSENGAFSSVQQFGPINAPGLTSPPAAADDQHGALTPIRIGQGLGIDESDGRLYVASAAACCGGEKDGVYILDDPSPPPTATLDSLSDVTPGGVTAHATINPSGPPALSYHFEYSTDGTSWKSTRDVVLGSQKTPQSVTATIAPPGSLEPGVTYHVRLVAKRPLLAAIVTPELTFLTPPAPPLVESTGSPVRTATTARLDSRVDPNGTATTYYFEYGTEGPCDSSPCTATEAQAAGSGREIELVSQQLSGLEANTTYHYRVVADNGVPGSPLSGEDMTVTTRASDAALGHGHLPGPVGSDRAWEQVNMPDTGGNPVGGLGGSSLTINFSDNGNRALFGIAGGTPTSETGSLLSLFFSERSVAGWQTKRLTPSRSELRGGDWGNTVGTPDFSVIVSANTDFTTGDAGVWRLDSAGQPKKLFQRSPGREYRSRLGLSADGSRIVALLGGEIDPSYPELTTGNLYDLSSGEPHLTSILPGGGPCAAGIVSEGVPPQSTHWVSADGSRVFFPCKSAIYMRNIEAAETKWLSGPPVTGPDCGGTFLKSVPGAAFFFTQSRLVADDTTPSHCVNDATMMDGDVYRYDTGDETLKCVTCVISGEGLNVRGGSLGGISVAEDGSRIYFANETRLLPGAPKEGGTYRLDLPDGDLAYVAPRDILSPEITPDGSVLVFDSHSPSLNSLGGQDNAGTTQAYRYDDRDRSLVCVSCPADGSAPVGDAFVGAYQGRKAAAVSADGNVLAFLTPTPLADSDQNTSGAGQESKAGNDVYEWRDGRLLLVTDGLTNWTSTPNVSGVSPSGRDIFFLAAAQYTPDALDGYQRLYDARIGGGFEFPKPPPPCPLEVCQGTPKGAPEEQAPGSGSFAGPGNAVKPRVSCRKGKVGRKGRCAAKKPVRKHHSSRANNDRRSTR